MKTTIVSERIATNSSSNNLMTSSPQQTQTNQYNHYYSKNATFSSTSALPKVSLLLLIIISASKCCEGIGSDGQLAQPIVRRSRSPHQALPECIDEKSVCGYVQLNSMGISSQPICKCKAGIQCPLTWNPVDGRTVAHGNDQYKYCNRAPNLKHCSRDDIVYTTYLETSMNFMTFSMKTLLNTNYIHCLCPSYYLFIRNSTKFHDINDGTSIIGTSYQCKPPPLCGVGSACLGITESAHSSFISRNCVCPIGTFCPNDVRLASERVDLTRGAYYVMNCI